MCDLGSRGLAISKAFSKIFRAVVIVVKQNLVLSTPECVRCGVFDHFSVCVAAVTVSAQATEFAAQGQTTSR